jgi:NitT/TauT family transport system substrate-binding protein
MSMKCVALMLAAGVLVAAGCGGDQAGGDPASEGGRTRLTVRLLPIWDVAPVYLGIKKGFFADEELELDIELGQGGAETVAPVLDGTVQIGYSNTPSLFHAAVAGLPIEIVAPAAGPPPEKQGNGENLEGAVMVMRDSSIRSYADLEGKTVAVNALGSVADLTLQAALNDHGIDPGNVENLEVPFPDMQAALDAGHVDAAVMVSPWKTMAELSGDFRSVAFPTLDVWPDLVYTGYFVSRDWADENPDVLERFLAALHRSMMYAAEHERETRATIGEFTKLPKELIPAIPIGNRRPDCQELETSSDVLARLMVEYGALDRAPDLEELIRPGFCDQ